MLANNNIKYKTDTIGFFVIIMNIPEKIAIKANKSKKVVENPLNESCIINTLNIIKILLSFLLNYKLIPKKFSFLSSG
jgi:hypothetical protein